MADKKQLLPSDREDFFPKGSGIMLVVHLGIGIFFMVGYFLFYSNIETIKTMILVYYTLFNVFFLFFYFRQLKVRRIFLIWVLIAFMQLLFYLMNINNVLWNKWSFSHVLSTLVGLPIVLALYQAFRWAALKRAGKELVIGLSVRHQPNAWDFVATVGIPLIVLLVTLF